MEGCFLGEVFLRAMGGCALVDGGGGWSTWRFVFMVGSFEGECEGVLFDPVGV